MSVHTRLPNSPIRGTIDEMWYLSGKVERFHTRYGISQSIADHSWGVAMFILRHNPRAPRDLIVAALKHDMPEYISGDSPGPAKRFFPQFNGELTLVEEAADRMMQLPPVRLTKEEGIWLKLADRMECLRFVAMCVPEPFASQVDREALERESHEFCVELGITLKLPDGREIGEVA